MLLSGVARSWLPTPSANRLLSREFEDGSVYFDPETGETLLLSSLASFLLERCVLKATYSLTPAELLAQVLAADNSSTDVATVEMLVDHALNELQRTGLLAHGG